MLVQRGPWRDLRGAEGCGAVTTPAPATSDGSATSRSDDVPLVGGKNASLGELHRELTGAGSRVPDGFAITAEAYAAILDARGS